jgi:hypothetical protein
MEPGASGAELAVAQESARAPDGLPTTAALATLVFSPAIGCAVARRWPRGRFWLFAEWAAIVLIAAVVVTGHPRIFWVGVAGLWLTRMASAIDARRVLVPRP